MMQTLYRAGVAVMLTGPASAQVAIDGSFKNLSATTRVSFLKTARSSLRDPTRTEFRNLFEPKPGLVCGEANLPWPGRGYNGFGFFWMKVGTADNLFAVPSMPDVYEALKPQWQKMCRPN